MQIISKIICTWGDRIFTMCFSSSNSSWRISHWNCCSFNSASAASALALTSTDGLAFRSMSWFWRCWIFALHDSRVSGLLSSAGVSTVDDGALLMMESDVFQATPLLSLSVGLLQATMIAVFEVPPSDTASKSGGELAAAAAVVNVYNLWPSASRLSEEQWETCWCVSIAKKLEKWVGVFVNLQRIVKIIMCSFYNSNLLCSFISWFI